MISVVLAEDQALLRGALGALLALEDDIEIIATAEDGDKALRCVQQHEPDILITDIEMPGLTGIELAEHISRRKFKTKIIIITTFGRFGYMDRARKAGVRGYLLKDAPSDQLIETIRKVHASETFYADGLTEPRFQEDPLTNRDRRILRLAEKGLTNKEIGQALRLRPGTVRNYLSEALEKLEVSNRIEGFRVARENGWL